MLPAISQSFSPSGHELAITEGIKLYTVARDGTYGHIWVEENETVRPVEGAVWSPDGKYITFMADRKQNCSPCRVVGLVRRLAPRVRILARAATRDDVAAITEAGANAVVIDGLSTAVDLAERVVLLHDEEEVTEAPAAGAAA